MKTPNRNHIFAAAMATAGILLPTIALGNLPRGADVDELAGNCNIGPFQQTSKAGPYNVLCDVMEDPEKCLALIKQHFIYNGETVTVLPAHQTEKAAFCVGVIAKALSPTE